MPQLSLHTPLGPLTLSQEMGAAFHEQVGTASRQAGFDPSEGAIVALDWGWGRDQTETPLLLRARDQLHAYFDGTLHQFDLPLAPAGTPYRRCIWAELVNIPWGETRTYLQLAQAAGGSPRAVGGAMGANPIPIIIPCHRVLATNGIGGYSGGEGLPTKRFLLALESRPLESLRLERQAPESRAPERSPHSSMAPSRAAERLL